MPEPMIFIFLIIFLGIKVQFLNNFIWNLFRFVVHEKEKSCHYWSRI
jgi:hypothetical protein